MDGAKVTGILPRLFFPADRFGANNVAAKPSPGQRGKFMASNGKKLISLGGFGAPNNDKRGDKGRLKLFACPRNWVKNSPKTSLVRRRIGPESPSLVQLAITEDELVREDRQRLQMTVAVTVGTNQFLWCCTLRGMFIRPSEEIDLVEWEISAPPAKILAYISSPVWEDLVWNKSDKWDGLIVMEPPALGHKDIHALVSIPLLPGCARCYGLLRPQYTREQMEQALRGDRLLVNKFTYRLRSPERGELLVFRSPKDRRLTWIKRVIGLPGDTVELKNNEVFVNDRKLERDRVPGSSLPAIQEQLNGQVFEECNAGRRYKILLAPLPANTANFPKTLVPEGTCFVLGDSRDNSVDSRDPDIGFVPFGDILGHVEFIYYPALTWTRFGELRD
jgi:signal peptidase I